MTGHAYQMRSAGNGRGGVRWSAAPVFVSAFFAWLALSILALPEYLEAALANQSVSEDSGRRVALVVGNTAYTSIEKLPNASRDASSVAEALLKAGFDVTVVEDATGLAFDRAVKEVERKAQGAEAVLFYYSGHGFQLGGTNYLVPVDATLRDRSSIDAETLKLDTVVKRFSGRGRQTLVFLDACRNNPLPPSWRASVSGRGLAELKTGQETFVAFATEPGAITADGTGENSPFTAAFLDHVSTPGLSVMGMMTRVTKDVFNNTVGNQTPWIQSSLRSEFVITPDVVTEEEAISAEDIELLTNLPVNLRIRTAKLLGVELDADGNVIVPEPVGVEVAEEEAVAEEEVDLALADTSGGLSFGAPPELASQNESQADELTPSKLSPSVPTLDGTVVVSREGTPTPTFRSGEDGSTPDQNVVVAVNTAGVSDTVAKSSPVSDNVPAPQVAERSRRTVTGFRGDQAVPVGNDGTAAGRAVENVLVATVDRSLIAPRNTRADGSLENVVARSVDISTNALSSDASVGSLVQDRRVLRPLSIPLPRIIGQDITPVPANTNMAALPPLTTTDTQRPAIIPTIEAKRPAPGSVTTKVPPPINIPADLASAIQSELLRVRCYRGAVDGLWGGMSVKAATRYALRRNYDPGDAAPTADLYVRLKAEEAPVCRGITPRKAKPKVVASRGERSTGKKVKKRTRVAPKKKRNTRNVIRKQKKKNVGKSTRTKKKRVVRAKRSTGGKPKIKRGGAALRGVFR